MSQHNELKAVGVVKPRELAVAPPPASVAMMSSQEELFSQARLIQAMSKAESCTNPHGASFVKGDVVVYPQRIKIADYTKPFSFVFLRNTLDWALFEVVGQKEEWRGEEPRTLDTETLPLEFTHDGKKMKRYRQITMYGLLPQQVKLFLDDAVSDDPKNLGFYKPVGIKTRNYSSNAFKEILDKVQEIEARNKLRAAKGLEAFPLWGYEFLVQSKDKDNKKGIFQIFHFLKVQKLEDTEVLKYARDAFETVSKMSKIQTIQMDEEQASSGPRGEVSDEV